MDNLEGLVIINGKDIWKEFGAFLTEEKRGGRDNLSALLAPAKAKGHVGVGFRELDGTKYSADLAPRSEERDVTLHFALFAPSRDQWLANYRAFIAFLKQGDRGWLRVELPSLGLEMRMFYIESSAFRPLTCLWQEGVHASRFKVKLREPEPTF